MRLPLDFSLRNDQQDSILYLPDGPQELFFEIANIALNHPIVLEDKGDVASADTFHIQLLFRPRVLKQIEVIRLAQGSGALGSDQSIAIAEGGHWNLAVSTLDPFNLAGQGSFVVLSLLRVGGGEIPAQSRLSLLLAGLNPDARLGTRASRVEVKYDVLAATPIAAAVGGDGAPADAPLQGVVMHHLNLINESRKVFEVAQQVGAVSSAKAGPFQATLIGANTLVNDGKSTETLRIRVMNPDQDVDVQLLDEDEPTQFRVEWDVVPTHGLHGLIAAADGDAIATEMKDVSGFWSTADGRRITWSGNGPATWKQGASFDVTLNVAKSTAPAGYATIRIVWSHFPGFKDGQLVLLVNVGPMFVEEGVGEAPATIAQGTALPLKLVDKAPLEFFRTNFRDPASSGANSGSPDASLKIADDNRLQLSAGAGLRVQDGSAQFVTNDGKHPLIVSRTANADNETISVGITDTVATVHYKNDEQRSRLDFRLQNSDTESGRPGTEANDNTLLSLVANPATAGVGIGTIDPGNFRLKVSGTADITGALSAGGITATGDVRAANASLTGLVSSARAALGGATFSTQDGENLKVKIQGDAAVSGNLTVSSDLRANDIEIGFSGSSAINSIRHEQDDTGEERSSDFHKIRGYLEISASNHGVLSHGSNQMLLWDDDGVTINPRHEDGSFRVEGASSFSENVAIGTSVDRNSDNALQVNGDVDIDCKKVFIHTGSDNTAELIVGTVVGAGGRRSQTKITASSVSSTQKNFRITHPLHSENWLVHSCIEGPEAGVYYRGTGRLQAGRATIELPDYFEALTRLENRTVMLTARGETPFLLSHSSVEEGRFSVFGTLPDGEFSWEVKAVRADVPELVVEVPANEETSHSDGANIPLDEIIRSVP